MAGLPLLRVKSAVRAQSLSILLQHIRVEKVAVEWVIATSEDGNPLRPDRALLIDRILGSGVRSAESGVIRTREEGMPDAGAGVVVCVATVAAALLRCFPARLAGGGSCVGLLVSIGGGNDDLELAAVVTRVGCGSCIDAGAPESTLVVCNGGGEGAVSGWVEGGIPLNEDVETGAKGCVVTVLAAGGNVIRLEGLEAEVGVGTYGCVQVDECLDVTGGSLG